MTRLHLVLTMACVTGAAATTSATFREHRSAPSPVADVAPNPRTYLPAHSQADVAWLAKYGTYDVRQGTWRFLLRPDGC